MVCMSKYVLKRLAMLIPVLIGVTFMVYFILSLSPGDTAAMIAGESADAETIEATRKDLGLDQPVIVQYGKYILNLLHGDMGKSYKTFSRRSWQLSRTQQSLRSGQSWWQ